MRRGESICLLTFFCSHKFHKKLSLLVEDPGSGKKPDFGSETRDLIRIQKNALVLSVETFVPAALKISHSLIQARGEGA